MSVKWRGKRLENHCAVAEAILAEADESYGKPDDLEEACELLEDANTRLDTIYRLARAIEQMGMRMDDGLRDKGDKIEQLEYRLETVQAMLVDADREIAELRE